MQEIIPEMEKFGKLGGVRTTMVAVYSYVCVCVCVCMCVCVYVCVCASVLLFQIPNVVSSTVSSTHNVASVLIVCDVL